MIIERTLKAKLLDHIQKKHKSLLLLGPRQTGKSFLLKSLNPDLIINLAKESEYQEHIKDPSLIEKMILPYTKKKGGVIFVDEVQRIPEMMNTIQYLIDDYKNIVFLLSGSSPRKLKKKEVNLLPGRLFSHQLFPLSYWELGDEFNLIKCLTLGSLPEIYLEHYGPDLLLEYIDGYLREEIKAEAVVRNIASFSRFVDLAAVSSWQEINYSQWASDSEIPKESLRRYMDILSDTLLVHRIPGFTQIKSQRKTVQKEKYLFFDLGVRNGILKMHNNKFTPDDLGHLFEQWIVLQIIIFNSVYKKNWKIFYYRDDKKTEVDLIIETSKNIYAIEIKWAQTYKEIFKLPLEDFYRQIGKKDTELIILYRGKKELEDKKIKVSPYQNFLDKLTELE